MMNDDDHGDALKGLAVRLAAIADDAGERSMQALGQVQRSAAQMDEASRRLNGSADRFASEALTIIGTRSEQAVTARASFAGSSTTCMPMPPPPPAAFTRTG